MKSTSQRTVSAFYQITARAESLLLWIFTVLLLADVLLGILARYVHFQIVFADELGKYLFIWLCAIGISAATKDNQHVKLTFIAAHLPFNRKFVAIISDVLFLCCCLFFLYWSLRLTWMHVLMNKSVMGFRFPMYWFTAALPFGFALTALRLIQDILRIAKDKKPANIYDANEMIVKESSG